MKKCPFCEEEIQDEAIKCRFCMEMLEEAPRDPMQALKEEAQASWWARTQPPQTKVLAPFLGQEDRWTTKPLRAVGCVVVLALVLVLSVTLWDPIPSSQETGRDERQRQERIASQRATEEAERERLKKEANTKVKSLTSEAIEAAKVGDLETAAHKARTAMDVPRATDLDRARRLHEQIVNGTNRQSLKTTLMILPDDAFAKLRDEGTLPTRLVSGYEGLDEATAELVREVLPEVMAEKEEREKRRLEAERKRQEERQKALEEREEKEKALAAKVLKLPASDIDGNLKLYKELLAIDPNSETYQDKVSHYQKKWDQSELKRKYRASCKLELLSSRWSRGYGHVTYEGQVKNISDSKLTNVQAIVTWYDKAGGMITSGSALIEYNPILAGQTSPFSVIKTYNPAMEKAGVEFSHLMGGTIRTYREK